MKQEAALTILFPSTFPLRASSSAHNRRDICIRIITIQTSGLQLATLTPRHSSSRRARRLRDLTCSLLLRWCCGAGARHGRVARRRTPARHTGRPHRLLIDRIDERRQRRCGTRDGHQIEREKRRSREGERRKKRKRREAVSVWRWLLPLRR